MWQVLQTTLKATYQRLFSQKKTLSWEVDLNQKVKDTTFVVIDTETTGLDLKKDEVLSVGAYKIRDLTLSFSERLHLYLKTDLIKAEESIKIHGITPDKLKQGLEKKEALLKLLEFIKGSVLVGYFLEFDIEMLKKHFQKELNLKVSFYGLDVLDLYPQKSLDRIPKLIELLEAYNLPKTYFHSALEDSYMTALLFLKLVYSYQNKKLKKLPLKII
ncbi:exonuclease domain-containing protein [Thermodesulfobacterium sp. TA1]|uniref:exonuclease domain-containing protein n=1 Tax=Thermodesulfobacterium sp. TA1 TaxID=2234087 RepID=UPI00143CDB4F|nr:exonuclease domain-containing protein [Thermodesulfobacterium sp. TA1]